jgi:hypothetical protein
MSIGAPQYRDTNVETLTGAKTLVVNDAYIQALDPGGGARTVTLPALAKGLMVVVANRADAAEVITINSAAGTAIATPTENETAICWCDGTNWFGAVGDDA